MEYQQEERRVFPKLPASEATSLDDPIQTLLTLEQTLPSLQNGIRPDFWAYVSQIQQIAANGEIWDIRITEAGNVFAWAALVLQYAERFAEAEQLLRQSLAIWEYTLSTNDPLLDQTLYSLAILCERQKNYVEAENLLRRAILLRNQTIPADNPTTLLYLNSLGYIYERLERLKEAEQIYRKTLALCERDPLSHAALSNTLRFKLARCILSDEAPPEDRLTEVKEFLNAALAYYLQTCGPEHLATARVKHKLAEVFLDQLAWETAEVLLQDVRQIYETLLPPEHPELLEMQYLLGYTYAAQAKWNEQTLNLLMHVYNASLRTSGLDNVRTLEIANYLVPLAITLHKWELAETLLQQLHVVYEKRFGSEDLQTGQLFEMQASIHMEQQHWEQAEHLYLRALAIYERLPEQPYLEILHCLQEMIPLYQQQENVTQIAVLQQRIYALWQKLAAEQDRSNAVVGLNGLAELYLTQEKFAVAEKLLLDALAVCKRFPELGYLVLTRILQNLTIAYQGQGKQAFAEEMMRRVEELKEILGTPLVGLGA